MTHTCPRCAAPCHEEAEACACGWEARTGRTWAAAAWECAYVLSERDDIPPHTLIRAVTATLAHPDRMPAA